MFRECMKIVERTSLSLPHIPCSHTTHTLRLQVVFITRNHQVRGNWARSVGEVCIFMGTLIQLFDNLNSVN